jgi:signal transduction histidine kinase
VTGALASTVLAALSPPATPQASLGALFVARSRRFPVAVAVAALGVAAHAVQGAWRPHGGLPHGWWLLLIVAAYAALVGWGALWQANRALLESLRERARRAEPEQGRRVAEARTVERNRIAREMHDVLAHRLSVLATYAGALEYRPDASLEQLSHAAAVVRDSAHLALDELRK